MLCLAQFGFCFAATRKSAWFGEATTFQQTVQSAIELKLQVVVMDLHIPDGPSVKPEEIKTLLKTLGSRLIAISFWNDEDTRALAESFGAVTFLDKMRLVTELIPTIEAAAINNGPRA